MNSNLTFLVAMSLKRSDLSHHYEVLTLVLLVVCRQLKIRLLESLLLQIWLDTFMDPLYLDLHLFNSLFISLHLLTSLHLFISSSTYLFRWFKFTLQPRCSVAYAISDWQFWAFPVEIFLSNLDIRPLRHIPGSVLAISEIYQFMTTTGPVQYFSKKDPFS